MGDREVEPRFGFGGVLCELGAREVPVELDFAVAYGF